MNLTKKEQLALLAVGVYMIIMMVGMYTMKHIYHIDYSKPQMVLVLVYFMPFSMLSALIFYYKFFRGTAFKKIKINPWIIEFFIAGLILACLQMYFGNYQDKDMMLIWTIIATTFMVGIGEEMLFRGIVFNAFREKRGVYMAILISASIFGVLHITNLLGGASLWHTLAQVFSAGISGIVFAWVFYKTQNIIPTMMYHWVWDMFLILGLYIPVSQTQYVLMIQNIFEQVAGIVLIVVCIRVIRSAKKNSINFI